MSETGRDPFAEEASFVQWAGELGKEYVAGSQSDDMPMRERSNERIDGLISRGELELERVEEDLIAAGELTQDQVALDRIADETQLVDNKAVDYGLKTLEWLIENPDKSINDFPG